MCSLSDRLQYLLTKHGIKPATLAKELNLNKSTLSRILSGSSIPTIDTMFKVSTYFGVPLEYFMTGKISCPSATYDLQELNLLDLYRKLSSTEQIEILELVQFKLSRAEAVKRAPKELVKSTTLMTTEDAATIEKMA